jgi:hypothetical protein
MGVQPQAAVSTARGWSKGQYLVVCCQSHPLDVGGTREAGPGRQAYRPAPPPRGRLRWGTGERGSRGGLKREGERKSGGKQEKRPLREAYSTSRLASVQLELKYRKIYVLLCEGRTNTRADVVISSPWEFLVRLKVYKSLSEVSSSWCGTHGEQRFIRVDF